MKIERLQLQLNLKNQHYLRLSELQNHYWSFLKTGATLQETVAHFLSLGWLVNFTELVGLVEQLAHHKLIQNLEILNELNFRIEHLQKSSHAQTQHKNSIVVSTSELQSIPFFRSLDSRLVAEFAKSSFEESWPAGTCLCQAGEQSRDLFILKSGQLAIYKQFNQNQRLRVAMMGAGSVFGEIGFFLNQVRTADIVASTDIRIIRVKHRPIYDQWIQQNKAAALVSRFWIFHAISQSALLKELPDDSLDALVFAGQVLKAKNGTVLFQEGRPGQSCYLLIQGSVVVSQKGRSINVLKQGDCFGEIALFYSQGQRTATVSTQTDCLLLEITQQNFYKILSENIWLAREIEQIAIMRLKRDAQRSQAAG